MVVISDFSGDKTDINLSEGTNNFFNPVSIKEQNEIAVINLIPNKFFERQTT